MSVYTPEEMRQQASRLEFFGQFNEDIIASVVSMLRYAADQLAAQSAPPTPGEIMGSETCPDCQAQHAHTNDCPRGADTLMATETLKTLRDYVQHKPGCAYLAWMRGVEYNEQPCSCGLAALLDAERGEGWQPIESGPKDGTPVLLWWPHHASRALIGVCHFDHWSSEGANGCQRVQPTHWMPLPKGPNHAA
jgi:hypothetical protein